MYQESLLKYEFIKEANPLAGRLSSFLLTSVPKFFKGIQGGAAAAGITAKNVNVVRAATTVGGAGIGATVGAAKAPEGQRGQGALKGAIVGGALGFGAGFGASKLPTLGNKIMEDAANVGKFLEPMSNSTMSNKQVGRRLTDYLAGMKGTVTPVSNAENITMTPGLWRKGNLNPNIPTGRPSSTEGMLTGRAKSAPFRGISEVADYMKTTRQKGFFKGTADVLGRNIDEAKRYRFDITPENVGNFPTGTKPGTYVFQRSGIGKALNVATSSGAGIGAAEALTASNEDGTSPTIGKRLRKGAVGTLTWGIAPRLTGAKMLAYDLPKSFMSGNKQPQVENYY